MKPVDNEASEDRAATTDKSAEGKEIRSAATSRCERARKWLVGILWFEAVVLLSALTAVALPHSLMSDIHAEMGLGVLPESPIVSYLTRTLSALYATYGPLYLFLVRDIPRYIDVIRFLAWTKVVFGVFLLLVDLTVGMPAFWTVCEGPLIVLLSAATIAVARPIASPAASPVASPIASPVARTPAE